MFLNRPVKGLAKAIYMYNKKHERDAQSKQSRAEPRGESRNAY